MKSKLLHLPFGRRGATETLFGSALGAAQGPDYSGIYYICPSPAKVKEARRVFHGLLRHSRCYIPPEMTTIRNLSKKLCSTYSEKLILPGNLAPVLISALSVSDVGLGFSAIIADFISEMKRNFPSRPLSEIKDLLLGKFNELAVPDEMVKRLTSAFALFETYQEAMEKSGAMDEDDAVLTGAGHAEKLNIRVLLIDSFYELTEAEKVFLGSLINKAGVTIASVSSVSSDGRFAALAGGYTDYLRGVMNNFEEETLKAEHGQIKKIHHPFPSTEEELEGIARHIKSLYISGRNRDLSKTAVVFPALKNVKYTLRRVFSKYGIPHTLSGTVLDKSHYLDLLRLLEAVSEDYGRLPLSGFLGSAHFNKIPDSIKEFAPKMSLFSGIIKGKESWLRSAEEFQPKEELQKSLRHVFERLRGIKETDSKSGYIRALSGILRAFDFSSPEKTDYSDELENVFKGFLLVENITGDSTSGRKVTALRAFIEGLRHIMGSTPLEEEGTGVQVMDFSDTQGLEPEFLYFGGLKDGDIPSRPAIDLLMPEGVRAALRLSSLKRHLLREEFLFGRLLYSSKETHLSYPEMEGDKFYLPSVYLSDIAKKKERVPGVFSKEEQMLRREEKNPLQTKEIKSRLAKRKFRKTVYIRVTDIDAYRSCPRRFFIEKVLDVAPPETVEYEIEAALLGKLMHRTMELLMQMPFSGFEEFTANAREAAHKVISESPLDSFWRGFIKESFMSIAPDIYEIEEGFKKQGFKFINAEMKVRGEPISGIKLKGSIDRIDGEMDDPLSVRVLDYKTGSADLSASGVLKKGASLQLFLYATMLEGLGMKPLRVGIYSLKDLKVSWVPGRNDKKPLKEYMDAAAGFLDETVRGMRAGDFRAAPLNIQTCRRCHERPYCPYIQGEQ